MRLDTDINMNEILNTVLGDNSDADIDLGCEENFYNDIIACNSDSLYIPIIPTLSVGSVIPMIADKDTVDHVPKSSTLCGRIHICAHGSTVLTLSFT